MQVVRFSGNAKMIGYVRVLGEWVYVGGVLGVQGYVRDFCGE